jgi:hypothetical protein
MNRAAVTSNGLEVARSIKSAEKSLESVQASLPKLSARRSLLTARASIGNARMVLFNAKFSASLRSTFETDAERARVTSRLARAVSDVAATGDLVESHIEKVAKAQTIMAFPTAAEKTILNCLPALTASSIKPEISWTFVDGVDSPVLRAKYSLEEQALGASVYSLFFKGAKTFASSFSLSPPSILEWETAAQGEQLLLTLKRRLSEDGFQLPDGGAK